MGRPRPQIDGQHGPPPQRSAPATRRSDRIRRDRAPGLRGRSPRWASIRSSIGTGSPSASSPRPVAVFSLEMRCDARLRKGCHDKDLPALGSGKCRPEAAPPEADLPRGRQLRRRGAPRGTWNSHNCLDFQCVRPENDRWRRVGSPDRSEFEQWRTFRALYLRALGKFLWRLDSFRRQAACNRAEANDGSPGSPRPLQLRATRNDGAHSGSRISIVRCARLLQSSIVTPSPGPSSGEIATRRCGSHGRPSESNAGGISAGSHNTATT